MQKVDYLIIGQGIAGTSLSFFLWKKKISFLIIDNPDKPSASKASAGICNPITGRKWLKTWKVDLIFPFLHNFYKSLERHLRSQVLYKKQIYRPFRTIAEQNQWSIKSIEKGWSEFVDMRVNNEVYSNFIDNSLGGWQTKQAVYVDIEKLITSYKEWLLQQNFLLQEKLEYEDIKVEGSFVFWKNIEAKKIIFCEGASSRFNPFFKNLPFSPVKGEWIKIIADNSENLNNIINAGFFMLPLPSEKNTWKVGATYEWDNLDSEPTEKAKKHLENKLKKTFLKPYEIIEQRAGVRPASKDRRPILGIHPNHKTLVVFNGLGTKGVSLAPFFAHHLLEHLEEGKELIPEVDILRFQDNEK